MLAAALVSPELGRAAPAVVIVVRHAEKAAAPAEDPPLTAAGKKRAEELVRVVALWRASGAKVTGLFATEEDVKRFYAEAEAALAWLNLRVLIKPAVATSPAVVLGPLLDGIAQ